jgi:hypothetical protein
MFIYSIRLTNNNKSLIFFEESKDVSMPPIVLKVIPIYSDLKTDIGK